MQLKFIIQTKPEIGTYQKNFPQVDWIRRRAICC